jgi:thiol-disulfide isomerase/thioredoxin
MDDGALENGDEKYAKRKSQDKRLMLRFFLFATVMITVFLRFRMRAIFQFVHDHQLPFSSFLHSHPDLIHRMIPNEEPAFNVSESFDEADTFLKKTKPPFFVLYYANWCPHSARAIPVVQEFAKNTLQPLQIPLIAIEEENPLSDKISGFPTIYLHVNTKDGQNVIRTEFTSRMVVSNLVGFLIHNLPEAAHVIKPIKTYWRDR